MRNITKKLDLLTYLVQNSSEYLSLHGFQVMLCVVFSFETYDFEK